MNGYSSTVMARVRHAELLAERNRYRHRAGRPEVSARFGRLFIRMGARLLASELQTNRRLDGKLEVPMCNRRMIAEIRRHA